MRYNAYENGKMIGQEYQGENGEWRHKWTNHRTGMLERGSWRGRCRGDNEKTWTYEKVNEQEEEV